MARMIQSGRYRGVWLPLLYGLTLLALAPVHSMFSEYTGPMQYFSGKELLSGGGYHGWASEFWPPLFSLLIGSIGLFWSGFFAGKLISIVSGSLLLWVAYEAAADFSGLESVRLWAQMFLGSSPIYLSESLQADNHMLDALIFNCGLLLFLRSAREARIIGLFLAGTVCGLAGLTRYTSYVLVLLPCSLLGFQRPGRAVGFGASFIAGFAMASLPWWLYNAAYNGSPVHTLQYLNVYVGTFGKFTNSLPILWHWMAALNNGGPMAMIVGHPGAYTRNVIRNIPAAVRLLIAMAGALGFFVAPGVLECLLRLKPSESFAIFGTLVVSVVTVSQAYINPYMLLPWNPLMVMVGAAFLVPYLSRLEDRFPRLVALHARRWAVSLLLLVNLTLCVRALKEYRDEPLTDRPLVHLDEITRALKNHDPDIGSKVIMAIDPARAYYAGAKYLATPFEYVGSVDGLVDYKGISQRMRHYAPKYPSSMDESSLRADYLVYTRLDESNPWQPQDSAQFAFLLDAKSSQIPSNFRPIYQSPEAVVYEVDRTQGSSPAR
jgi:hypothetical protein